MSELAFLLLGYALEHLFASGIIALVVLTFCSTRAIAPGAKAGILLAALMLAVFGPLMPVPDGIGTDAGSARVQANARPLQAVGNAPDRFDSHVADRAAWTPGNIEIGEPMAMLLIGLWLSGASWQLARQARGYAGLRRVIASSKRSRVLEDEYRHLLRADVEIRLCGSFGPAVTGILHPKILIPERLVASLPEDALRAVLLHEATHIRRNDAAGYAFQKFVETVFWWNPMVRWMGVALDTTREIACDIEASRGCKTPADYADALLTAIEHIVPAQGGRFTPALGVTDALKTLDRRIDGIIEARSEPALGAKFVSIGMLLAMAAAWAAAEAAARPLAPLPARPSDIASIPPVESKPALMEAAADRRAASRPAGSSNTVSASSLESRSTATEAEDNERVAITELAERPRLFAEEEYRHAASQADQHFTTDTQAADEEYQHTAKQAGEDYITASQAADATYLQRFDELERATPGNAFEEGLSRARRERERTMSAVNGKYRAAMSAASAKYKTTMSVIDARYKTEIAQAKARHRSAMKAG